MQEFNLLIKVISILIKKFIKGIKEKIKISTIIDLQ